VFYLIKRKLIGFLYLSVTAKYTRTSALYASGAEVELSLSDIVSDVKKTRTVTRTSYTMKTFRKQSSYAERKPRGLCIIAICESFNYSC